MVILVPEVHDTEDLGGLGVLYHDHVASGVVGLYGHAQVVAGLVFVSHLVPWGFWDELARLLGEVDQDGPRLRKGDGLTIGTIGIDDGWYLVVRAYPKELRLVLFARGYVHGNQLVGQTRLLEEDRDLTSVRRRPVVEVYRLRHQAHPRSRRVFP